MTPGDKHHALTAVQYIGKTEYRHAIWEFRCICGTVKNFLVPNVLKGNTKSCGCRMRTNKGLTYRERYTYESLRAAIERCYSESHPKYANYGGRGIGVYFDWLGPGGFANFFAYMGRRPKNKTLDRIENNLGYEPGNVRWATCSMQRINQRRYGKKKTENG